MENLSKVRNLEKSNMLAEVELIYKSKIKPSEMPKIEQSGDIAEYLRTIWNEGRIDHVEEFIVLMLNKGMKITGWVKISQGGQDGTVCDPKLIFCAALLHNANSIVLSHNHPSGNLTPSNPDIQITQKIKNAGTMLDIKVLDHIIITNEGHYSFSDNGIL